MSLPSLRCRLKRVGKEKQKKKKREICRSLWLSRCCAKVWCFPKREERQDEIGYRVTMKANSNNTPQSVKSGSR